MASEGAAAADVAAGTGSACAAAGVQTPQREDTEPQALPPGQHVQQHQDTPPAQEAAGSKEPQGQPQAAVTPGARRARMAQQKGAAGIAGPPASAAKRAAAPKKPASASPPKPAARSEAPAAADGAAQPAAATPAPEAAAKPAAPKPKKKQQQGGALDKARLRNRAVELISQHAGNYAAEGQKTKWIIELVAKVVLAGKAQGDAQDARIAELQAQLEQEQAAARDAAAAAAAEAAALRGKVQELEAGLYNAGFTLQTLQREHCEMSEALAAAEGTAQAATLECAQLAAAVRRAGEQDARVRRSLAHRAFLLKSALVDTASRLRGAHDADRREFRESEWRLRERERALAAERSALLEAREEHGARDALLEAFMLRLHATEGELARVRAEQQGRQDQQAPQAQPAPAPQHPPHAKQSPHKQQQARRHSAIA